RIDDDWSCFRWTWSPKRSSRIKFGCVVFRHRVRKPEQGPIQLDLFRPIEREYEYKAVLTNKVTDPAAVLAFHNGRGAQEGTFAELKTDLPMGYLPSRRAVGNQVWLLSAVLAHALCRELQMNAAPQRHERNTPTREPLWRLERVDTLRRRWGQRPARPTRH